MKRHANVAEPVALRPERELAPTAGPSAEDIARRAYAIYLERGGAPGDPMDDWLRAEQELTELAEG